MVNKFCVYTECVARSILHTSTSYMLVLLSFFTVVIAFVRNLQSLVVVQFTIKRKTILSPVNFLMYCLIKPIKSTMDRNLIRIENACPFCLLIFCFVQFQMTLIMLYCVFFVFFILLFYFRTSLIRFKFGICGTRQTK